MDNVLIHYGITIPFEEHHPFCEKMEKWAVVDNIRLVPAEFIQVGGEAMIDILISICNKIWKTGVVDQMD